MAQDLHVGRSSPTFVVEGDPQKYINLINQHGVLARVMQSRICPCITDTGSPNMYCDYCHGDGQVYKFQRKLLEVDEDSDIRKDRNLVKVFRVPIIEPVSVERLLPTEQGDIKKYTIEGFDDKSIQISGSPLPLHWQKMRVSYYFDRYEKVINDQVEVNTVAKMLITTKTRHDDQHKTGNFANAHGDLALILRIYDRQLDHTFTNYTFRKNIIMLGQNEPTPTPGFVEVDYYYAPVTRMLPADLDSRNTLERWTSDLVEGNVRMALEPWYNLAQGDLITVLVSEFTNQEVIVHSGIGYDKLNEFDIANIDDEIIDEDGVRYFKNSDFYLRPFRQIVWIGNSPNVGKRISVRYTYRPTFKVFIDNPTPNNLENKRYPNIFFAKYYTMRLPKDIETTANTQYETGNSNPMGGFSDL